jgi:hypothetical protein
VRRGASWTAAYHLQLTVAVVARPDGVCPAERPADIQRSGIVALVDTARTPAMASVAGRCPASGVHPSGVVVPDPAVQPSGVQPVRCPVTWVRRPGVRRSGRLRSTRPVSSPLVSTRPASSRLVSAPSVQMCPSPPIPGGGVGPRSVRRAPVTTGTGRVPLGCRAVERFGRRPSRPGRERCCRLACWSAGAWVADPGPGWVRRRRVPAERPCQAGVRSARGWRRSEAQDEAAARGGRTCCVAAVGGLGGDHGAWWSWGLPPEWAGPEGPRGLLGDGRAAPARPGVAVSAPGSRPAAL